MEQQTILMPFNSVKHTSEVQQHTNTILVPEHMV